MEDFPLNRRAFLQSGGVAAAMALPGMAGAVSPSPSGEVRVRDRLWVWTHVPGAHNMDWNLPRPSRMTPAEGAFYLGVPNLLFIRYLGQPEMPYDPYAISFRPLKRVVWSLTGANGETSDEERGHVLDLAARFPNITGFVMDDFFRPDGTGALSLSDLAEIRSRLVIAGTRRDLYVVLYQHQTELPVREHLELCDKITFWTWKSEELENLERSFERLEQIAPNQGKLLGCYLWDYGNKAPMPVDLMKKQCALGRTWLHEGRIEGMIFLGSNVCDVELEAVAYVRDWIAATGEEAL